MKFRDKLFKSGDRINYWMPENAVQGLISNTSHDAADYLIVHSNGYSMFLLYKPQVWKSKIIKALV